MKIKNVPVVALAILFAACSGNGKNNDNAADSAQRMAVDVAEADILGQWYIENIVFSDTEYIRPAEEVPGSRQYILFEDSVYSIMTNCNVFSGSYTLIGDSIRLGEGMMTEMACDNMATEDALRQILPHISIVDIENDSIMRLNTDVASRYIVLRKADEIK